MTFSKQNPYITYSTGHLGSVTVLTCYGPLRVDYFNNQDPRSFLNGVHYTDNQDLIYRQMRLVAKQLGYV